VKKKVNELSIEECKIMLSNSDVPFDPKADIDSLRDIVRVNGLATGTAIIRTDQDTNSIADSLKDDNTREKLNEIAKGLEVEGYEDASTKADVVAMILDKDPNYGKPKGVTVVQSGPIVLPEKGEVEVRGLAFHECEMNKEKIAFSLGDVFKIESWKAKILLKAGAVELK